MGIPPNISSTTPALSLLESISSATTEIWNSSVVQNVTNMMETGVWQMVETADPGQPSTSPVPTYSSTMTSTSSSSNPSSAPTDNNDWSPGMIAGVVVGSVLGAVLVGGAVWGCIKYCRSCCEGSGMGGGGREIDPEGGIDNLTMELDEHSSITDGRELPTVYGAMKITEGEGRGHSDR